MGNECKEGPKCDVRQTSAMNVINRLRPKLNRLPLASAYLQPAQDLRIGGRNSNALYQYTIQSDNFPDLAHWGPILLAHMKTLPGLQDVNTDQQNGGLEEILTYNRTSAASLGQTSQWLDSSLYSAFGQPEVSVIYTQLNQYYVVMEVAPQYWQDPSDLNNIYFNTVASREPGPNRMSPLLGMVKPHIGTTPLQVNHTGLFPSVTVSFNLARRLFAERRHPRSDADGAEPGHADDRAWILCRNRPGLSAVALHRADPHHHGNSFRLHRAGNSL